MSASGYKADIIDLSHLAVLDAQSGKVDSASPIWAKPVRENRDRRNLF
jgi:hypothetical protein